MKDLIVERNCAVSRSSAVVFQLIAFKMFPGLRDIEEQLKSLSRVSFYFLNVVLYGIDFQL